MKLPDYSERLKQLDFEAKHVGVKRNRNIDVVNYISNADITHGLSPPEICSDETIA
jgi:hypothetical protein